MSRYDLPNRKVTDCRQDIPVEEPSSLLVSPGSPVGLALRKPFLGNGPKGVGMFRGLKNVIELSLMCWMDPLFDQFPGFALQLSRIRQPDLWITTNGVQILLASDAVSVPPELYAIGSNLKVQPISIGQLDWLGIGLCGTNAGIGKRHKAGTSGSVPARIPAFYLDVYGQSRMSVEYMYLFLQYF